MTVKFKYDNLRDEWRELLLRNPGLVHVVLSFARVVDAVTITEIWRTEAMQRSYYPTNATVKSVHQHWRGVDVSVKGLDRVWVDEIVEMLNGLHPYDPMRPAMKTVMVHDIGNGPHLHFQNMTGGTK